MEKIEAAEFLGVSVRTLERLVLSGRVSVGKKRGKTKPIPVFDRSSLEALKAELDLGKPSKTGVQTSTSTIGFRLEPVYHEQLKELSEANGRSPGEYARHLVIKALDGEAQSIEKLRESLSDFFYLLLIQRLGATEKEAEEILKESFA